jgi:outer membrane murein-binding lipoprotein Lpp
MRIAIAIIGILLLSGCSPQTAPVAEPIPTVPVPTVTIVETVTATPVVPNVPQVCLDAISGAQKTQESFTRFAELVHLHMEQESVGYEAALMGDFQGVDTYMAELKQFANEVRELSADLDVSWREKAQACQVLG